MTETKNPDESVTFRTHKLQKWPARKNRKLKQTSQKLNETNKREIGTSAGDPSRKIVMCKALEKVSERKFLLPLKGG